MVPKDFPVMSRSEAAEGSWLPPPIFRRHLHRSSGIRLRSRPSPGSSFSPTNDLYGTAGPSPRTPPVHTARRGFASSLFRGKERNRILLPPPKFQASRPAHWKRVSGAAASLPNRKAKSVMPITEKAKFVMPITAAGQRSGIDCGYLVLRIMSCLSRAWGDNPCKARTPFTPNTPLPPS
jgi:hypothetical protein